MRAIAVLTVAVMMTAGCAPYATYPPIAGQRGINNPEYAPVPAIIADSVRYVHERFGEGREFAINLPQGTRSDVYELVIEKLGEGRPMQSHDDWTYYVQEVRSRGLRAEADVIYPRDSAPPGFITVHLRKEFKNYSIASVKQWNLPVEMPPPYYTPPWEEIAQKNARTARAADE